MSKDTIYVVDDDEKFSHSLVSLLAAHEFQVQSFSSGDDFLTAVPQLGPGVVMLDLKMPKTNGVSVLDQLRDMEFEWPVVVMTGHGEIPLAVSCIQKGATDFLQKPFQEERLLGVLSDALRVSQKKRQADHARREQLDRLEALTPRERQVLHHLARGLSSKQIAFDLNLSVRTVEMHRANLLRRLAVRTSPEAIRVALEHQI